MRSPEEFALASLAQLGMLDPVKAVAAIDAAGIVMEDFGALEPIAHAVEMMLRSGRAPEVFAVAEKSRASREKVAQLLVADHSGTWLTMKEKLEALKEKADRRKMAAALASVREMVLNPSTALADCALEAQKTLGAVQSSRSNIRTGTRDLMELIDHVQMVYEGKIPPILETGMTDLDAAIGGFQPTLTVVGSLPGIGKSALLAGWLHSLGRRGVKAGMISLEDEGQWLVRRVVSAASRIPVFVLASKPLYETQKQAFAEATEASYAPMDCVLVDDRSRITTAEVVASARMMMAKGAKVIFVDHLGEIRLERTDRHDLDITEALQELRAMAKTHRIPVVVLCHLRRRQGLDGAADDEPRLTDFAFSSGVERMARVALALTRPDDSTVRVHVLKQTQGVANIHIDLEFNRTAGVVP